MNEVKIKTVKLVNGKTRKVVVTLSNKDKVIIEPCYESWMQYGSHEENLRKTVPIAERYNEWLHGGELPEMA